MFAIQSRNFQTVHRRNRSSIALTPADLSPEMIRDVREFTARLTRTEDISDADWPARLVADYCRVDTPLFDDEGREVFLDTEILYRRDRMTVLLDADELAELDHSDLEDFGQSLEPLHWRTWYRDNLMKPAGSRVRFDNIERWAVVINILRMTYPIPAMLWGKRLANDN